MKNRPVVVPDARLERLASARGPASAEAYVVLELREARSAGDHVFAFQANGRYSVMSASDQAKRHRSVIRPPAHPRGAV